MRFLISSIKIGAIAVIALLVLVGTRAAYNYATERTTTPTGQIVIVSIGANETTDSLAEDLKNKELITNTAFFRAYVFVNRVGDKIQAGSYPLKKGMSTGQILNQITGKTIVPAPSATVRIPEGSRIEEIPGFLRQAGFTAAATDFLDTAQNTKWDYEFLKNGAPSGKIEGFLFPDTYQFPLDVDAKTVIRTMLDNFADKLAQVKSSLPPEQRAKLPAGVGNEYQILIIASIVEREAGSDVDRGDIASVYYNRLKLQPRLRLQADPTVQYAVGNDQKWWRDVSPKDLDVNHPYNTYKIEGVTPTPICSPSLKSIRAAYAPTSTDFLFFVAKGDGSGTHAFARTNDEQNANIAKYAKKL